MRIAVYAWMALSAVYLFPFLHSVLGYPLTRKPPIPSPNPVISFEDARSDRPTDDGFRESGYRDITRGEAYSFTLGGAVTPCDRMWRSALRNMEWGDRVQLSGPVPGRTGICDWYQMRIVASSGEVKSGGLGRPGPRKTGQMPGIPKLENPNAIQRANHRPAGPPSFQVERLAPRR
jgi:hypothetical protein